eukprot:1160269-Pelagomonas_calceolata.AAC.6
MVHCAGGNVHEMASIRLTPTPTPAGMPFTAAAWQVSSQSSVDFACSLLCKAHIYFKIFEWPLNLCGIMCFAVLVVPEARHLLRSNELAKGAVHCNPYGPLGRALAAGSVHVARALVCKSGDEQEGVQENSGCATL